MRRIACLLALCVLPIPVVAAPLTPDMCKDAPPPPEPWTSWMQSGAEIAGGVPHSAPRLILGKPVVATLRPSVQVQYAVEPEPLRPKSHGGLFTLALKDPARVGIGLSGPARVDIVMDRQRLESVGAELGPECSTIRQIVWFDLPAGVHLIQIADSTARELRVMAADAMANRALPPAPEQEF